jgi:hypothetical protein
MTIKDRLYEHIGWEQVADLHAIDIEMGESPSVGRQLALLLLENAENQTGVWLDKRERNELIDELQELYT